MLGPNLKRSVDIDAFGRLRVGNPFTLFSSTQVDDIDPDNWEVVTTSSGSSSYDSNESSSLLTVAASGDTSLRQTHRYWPYLPGKSQRIVLTVNFHDHETNTTKRCGYYDDNDGIYFESNGTDFRCVVRTSTSGSPVSTVVATSADGTATPFSEKNWDSLGVDLSKSLIVYFDFEWLAVGSITFGIVKNRELLPIHVAHNFATLSTVWAKTPALPVRYEIIADGAVTGVPQLRTICATVESEGGFNPLGIPRFPARGIDAAVTVQNTGPTPLVNVRLRSGFLRRTSILETISILVVGNKDFQWWVYLNPTFTSGSHSWSAVETNSFIEQDTTQVSVITAGQVIGGGFATGSLSVASEEISSSYRQLAASKAGTADIISLAVQVPSTTPNGHGCMGFRDIR